MRAPTISLQELIQLYSSEPINWVSEQPTAGIEIGWIVSRPEEITPGDVILIPSDQFSSHIEQQTLKLGGAAILLVGGLTPGDKTTEYKLPIGSIPAKEPFQHPHQPSPHTRAHVVCEI